MFGIETNRMENVCKTQKMFIRAAERGLLRQPGPTGSLAELKSQYFDLATQVMRNEYGTYWANMVAFNDDEAEVFTQLKLIANEYAEKRYIEHISGWGNFMPRTNSKFHLPSP